ncbi:DUF397 domain-containing protein [Streptomyces sp. ISL-12]|uniref:DUF397 domain-containing protein n=1 Tax=Streptomyces sp. ISL-12 TaxID=2819177 RepID=UPI001BE82672|nr:DUF397 domain-containing protein [Streptomyces sp. ISL-12]MBT2415400.1 DUF397 domain-containing protein [Streptomyces sp. ISL-12]
MTRPKTEPYAYDLTGAIWRKASASGPEHHCAEVAGRPDGARAVKDSQNPEGPPLCFTAAGWAAFRAGVMAGEL